MPKKTKARTASPRARKGAAKRRSARQRVVRKPGGSAAPSIAVFGDSIHRVIFKEKIGPEVFFKMSGQDMDIENFEKVFNDLWKAYTNLHYILKKERIKFDLYGTGLNKGMILYHTIDSFKKLIPHGFLVNIDQEGNDYFFTIYRECEGWQRSWHAMEVGPAILKLKRENKKLLDLFLCFLRVFESSTGVNTWYQGRMGSTLDCMEDNALQLEEEGDMKPKDLIEYKKNLSEYQSGIPFQFGKLIRKAKIRSAEAIRRHAGRFKAGHPIANMICQGCELIVPGCNIYNYQYTSVCEEEAGYYLDFDSQSNIVWSLEDHFCSDHEESLDSIANEGVQEPCFSFRIDASLRKIDFKDFFDKCYWPGKLSQYFSRAGDLIEKYKHERSNRKAAKKL